MKDLSDFYPLFFLAYMGILFPAVSWLLGRMLGWYTLSQAYPYQPPSPGHKTWKFCSIPNLTLRNCVHVTIDQSGIYFEMVFLFRFGNPPIFVPWSDLSIQTASFIAIRTSKLTFKKAPSVSMQFYKLTSNKFAEYAGELWEKRKI
ncbi:MAG: hypothetical protein ACXVAX_01355 [Pseudobdellovibrio sp.]